MKVLVVRVGAMGDVLHALPAVAALRRARPDAVIDWVVDERWEALLAGDEPGVVRRTFPVAIRAWKKKPFGRETLRAVWSFRRLRGEYDVVVDMQGTLRSAVIGWMAGGGKRLVGYADPREAMAARIYGRRVQRRGEHVVQQGAALLGEALGVALDGGKANTEDTGNTELHGGVGIPRTAWAEEWAEREAVLRRPLALLAVSAGWGAKEWPLAKFAELAKALAARGFDVVVNAPRKTDEKALAVMEASGGTARMLVCNVAGLIALMRRTDLCVAGDSGPVHLAATLAVPVVALFGPTSPERNGPWGPGPVRVLRDPVSVTTYKRTPETEAGLARIPVEAVMAAVDDLNSEKEAGGA